MVKLKVEKVKFKYYLQLYLLRYKLYHFQDMRKNIYGYPTQLLDNLTLCKTLTPVLLLPVCLVQIKLVPMPSICLFTLVEYKLVP